MKVLKITFLIVGMICLYGGMDVFANDTLQSKINATSEGGTLHLKKGIYYEPIVLNKDIQVIGEKGVTFMSCYSPNIITINGENVHLKGVKIESCEKDRSTSAIFVKGKNHTLEDIQIDSEIVGIMLQNAENSLFKNIKISGTGLNKAFDIWKSPGNTFEGNQIDHVEDGFYMEYSDKNKFIRNTMSDSRYGLHVMYSNEIMIKHNVSTRNYTGAMIMESSNSVVQENKLLENNLNVNAQGLLLYNIRNSIFTKNQIANNRVGIYMENSSGNYITSNKVMANFIGTQIKNIKNNLIENNTFVSNVNELQAIKGTDNFIQNNYWDAAWKLDTDGDGKSNLPYHADPYFLNLTEEVPEYQLFFQHPGMLLLQKMLKSPENLLVTDESPLMISDLNRNSHNEKNKALPWAMSLCMIFSSLLFISIGRKTK